MNDPPTAAADSITAPESGSHSFEARATTRARLANEFGQGLGKPTITEPPAHGTASVSVDGTLTYTPTPGYAGTDSFKYRVCDDGTTDGAADPRCGEGTVSVVVKSAAEQLEDLINQNPGTPLSDKLEDALAKVEAAVGKLNRTPPDRQGALGELEGGVGELEAAVRGGLLPVSQAVPLMDRISRSARAVAEDAIAEALARGGNPRKINDARRALAEGDSRRASARFKDAIAKYKDAVSRAEGA